MAKNNISIDELHSIWALKDEYFQFTYEEYKSFGSRLKKWRELSGLSHEDIANSIQELSTILKRTVPKVSSITRKYILWEKADNLTNDFVFSMKDLFILKQIINCDYEFLFGECDTFHKNTKTINDTTGLSFTTIEYLTDMVETFYATKNTTTLKAYINTLNAIISDQELLTYLSYFTNTLDQEVEDEKIKLIIPTLSANNGNITLEHNDLLSTYMITLSSKLAALKRKYNNINSDTYSFNPNNQEQLCSANSPFGIRLKAWRQYKELTQVQVAELICDYQKENNLGSPAFDSIVRTYQNWESKKLLNSEVRIHISDLKMLKDIMKCDYGYLFGEFNTLKKPTEKYDITLGLSNNSMLSLFDYSHLTNNVPACANYFIKAIDSIVCDITLFTALTYYLSDLPLDIDFMDSALLKPNKLVIDLIPTDDDKFYYNTLFSSINSKDMLLPLIFNRLIEARKTYNKATDILGKLYD